MREHVAAAAPPETRRVRLGSSWDGPVHGLLALVFVTLQLTPVVVLSLFLVRLHPAAVAALLAATALAIFSQARRSLGPTEVLLGVDGLSVLSGGGPRFVPWREVRSVHVVRFDIADGRMLAYDESERRYRPAVEVLGIRAVRSAA